MWRYPIKNAKTKISIRKNNFFIQLYTIKSYYLKQNLNLVWLVGPGFSLLVSRWGGGIKIKNAH